MSIDCAVESGEKRDQPEDFEYFAVVQNNYPNREGPRGKQEKWGENARAIDFKFESFVGVLVIYKKKKKNTKETLKIQCRP